MTNKMKLSSPWPHWPSCNQPKTHSFRSSPDLLKTLNPTFHNSPGYFLSDSDDIADDETEETEHCIENVIRGLNLKSTERLFFKLEETNSILKESNKPPPSTSPSLSPSPSPSPLPPFFAAAVSPRIEEKGILLCMDSKNPYLDFKKSMEEMIESSPSSSSNDNNGLWKNWEFLEDLLCWYLKVNEKSNHGFICEAFVDLIFGFCSSTTTDSSSSPFSSITCSSSSLQAEKITVEDGDDDDEEEEGHHEIDCFSSS